MAYEISGYIDSTNAPTNAETLFSEWSATYKKFDSSSRYQRHDPRKDGTLQGYHEFSTSLLFTENVDEAITDLLENYFSDVTWLVVHIRHSTTEESKYENDNTYYSPTMDTGLRTTPSFSIESPHVRSYDSIEYRIDGINYTVSPGKIDFADIDLTEPVELYATTDETLVVDGNGVHVATASNNATIDGDDVAHIITENFSLLETDTSIYKTRGNPPSYFKNPDKSLPERLDPDYFARNYVTEESLTAIEAQINSINSDNKDVKDALNTIAYILTGDNRYK